MTSWSAFIAYGVAAAALAALGLALADHSEAALILGLGASGAAAWAASRSRPAVAAAAVSRAPVEPPPEPPRESSGFRDVLESLPDPVLIVEGGDMEDFGTRRILYANLEARSTFRLVEDKAPLVAALRDPEALEAVDEALFGGLSRDVSFSTAGAQVRHWKVSVVPLTLHDEEGMHAVVRFRDETDTVRMERMRADFLANASHELKTPLASLAGFIETLKGHARDDARARDHFLDIMAAQTARMGRMVTDLLSLSRIELSEHIPPSGRADASLAARDVVDALGPLLDQRQARIQLDAAPGEAVVKGERDQIIQVIQNLTENAVRYSEAGRTVGISVRGGLTAAEAQAPALAGAARLAILKPDRDEGALYALIRISDQGRGLAREHLPRLTERFYRVEGQKSGASPGTGLGLSIVKHIVNRHRGGLVVESVEGEGSVFSVYLPLDAAGDASREAARVSNKTVIETSR